MKVQVINRSPYPLPEYKSDQAAGLDLKAFISEPIVLGPLERSLVPTGISIALPKGYEAQIRPRSGMAFKQGIGVLNSPGTIDADYRGDIGILLVNLSNEAQTISPGDRVAQMVIAKHEQIQWEPVEALESTERGAGGFGSTGK